MKKFRFLLFSVLMLGSFGLQATNFYVDAAATSSTQNGSLANPWKTLTQVNSGQSAFNPGDIISFKCGGSYTGSLVLNRGGSASSPLTFNSYGTGAKPKFTGTGSVLQYLFFVNSKSYVIFRDLEILDPTVDINSTTRIQKSKIERAFCMDGSASYNRIINCKITAVGVGAYWTGPYNSMESCEVGDLTMVVDDNDGGVNDYGANPLVISSANNKVINNNFYRCWAHSYDFGLDGGAIEFYGNGASNNYIAYNTMDDCIGISELTGTSTGNKFHYNKMINNGSMFYFQNSGISSVEFYNNVVIENKKSRLSESRLFGGTMPAGTLLMRNNVFHISTALSVATSVTGIVHQNNIYKMSGSGNVGFSLDATERSTTAPIWTNTSSTDPGAWNYLPVTGSVIINAGRSVGIATDFAGNTVDATPNSGILEGGGGTTPPVNPLVVSSAATSINCNGGTSIVTISATGGTTPYSGTGTFTVTAGTYTYTVTDAVGSSAPTTIVIIQPTILNASVLAGTAPSASGTATASVTASGGTPSYTYSLDGGSYQSSNVFQGIPVGNHNITVRDGKACSVTKSFSIAATGTSPLVITAVAGTIACNGGTTTITMSATGGRAPYTGTGTFTVSAGNYTYTIKDANGTTGTTSVTVAQPSAINATLSAGTISLAGGVTFITVNATGGTAPYTYQSNGGSFQSTNTFSNLVAGTYAINVKDAKGCITSKSTTIAAPQGTGTLKIVLVSQTNNSCRWNWDGTITLGATGGTAPYLFSINTYGYGSNNRFVNLGPATYTVRVKDARGAISSMTVKILSSNVSCTGKTVTAEVPASNSVQGIEQKSAVAEEIASSVKINGLDLQAYPNPTTTEFTLVVNSDNNNEDIIVNVMNINGQRVYQGKTRAFKKINFGNDFISGVYIVKVLQGNTMQTLKLVKVK